LRVRAARGAIVVPEDSPTAIATATQRLLDAVLLNNEVATDDLISILFTATEDLSAAFPVPLLCTQEIPVVGSLPSVVRVLVHFHSDRTLDEVVHVYLDGAEVLRDDL
jgi:chorismate mutase